MKSEELFEVLDQLQESAVSFKTYRYWLIHMEEHREQLKEQTADGDVQRQGVNLMTMHSAKGLEFRVIYILGANEGVTPHHKVVLDSDVEEERRMFYVAMTRAKERLHIYHVKERYRRKQAISRFAEEAEG